jgi:hypothetical protein
MSFRQLLRQRAERDSLHQTPRGFDRLRLWRDAFDAADPKHFPHSRTAGEQNETAFLPFQRLMNEQEHTDSGAADVFEAATIQDDAVRTRVDQAVQEIGELARGGNVEPRRRLHDDVGLHKDRWFHYSTVQPLRQQQNILAILALRPRKRFRCNVPESDMRLRFKRTEAPRVRRRLRNARHREPILPS